MLKEASTLAAITDLRVPVLMAVGDRDRNLPGEQHSQVLAAAMGSLRWRLLQVRGATHVSLARRIWPELEAEILRFGVNLTRH